jgi:8-amino-7-oxononanoate synthase
VIGERSDDELSPYGKRGNSIVKYVGETYDTSCSSRACRRRTRHCRFLTCPPELKRLLKTAAPPYLYSGPSPSLARDRA